jgi:toluene monooxygenase system protein A
MLKREDWHGLARKLDWTFSYSDEKEAFPPEISGTPWLPQSAWQDWDEPYRTTYREYVANQSAKDAAVLAVRDAVGKAEDFAKLDPAWRNGLKLYAATLPLAEFAAVIGNLRAARFGRDSAWRNTATFGALDEFRHTQIPLLIMHELVRHDRQFDWTHKFFHSNNWIAIAGRHLVDEMLLGTDPIEYAVATNFVFETGFTNLQFIGLTAMADRAGDRMFEKMLQSIQTDEARHAQIGPPVLKKLIEQDPEKAQRLVDKWFWRTFLFFAVVTGFHMDYFTPLRQRPQSFKEFMEEWILDQFQQRLDEFGLKRPGYWPQFLDAIESYHHMVYASAYSYRATTWFDFVLPSPEERTWLAEKYPKTWPQLAPVWARIDERWRQSGPGVEWYSHGTTPVAYCELCQLVLCGGTPARNGARMAEINGRRHMFCSEPCEHIFRQEPERYQGHKDVVNRILAGEAPANVLELLRNYFGLNPDTWGKDVAGGDYPWLRQSDREPAAPC